MTTFVDHLGRTRSIDTSRAPHGGYPQKWIAEQLGFRANAIQFSRIQIRPRNAAKVRDLYDRLRQHHLLTTEAAAELRRSRSRWAA